MSVSEFNQILKAVKGYGDYLYLHIKGEPLLHPKLKEILALCQAYHFQVNITTNGTLLQAQKDILLTAPAVRQISISLQSFEEQDRIDDFKVYLNQVLEMVRIGAENTPLIFELRLWNYRDSKKDDLRNSLAIQTMEAYFETTIIRNFSNRQTKGFLLAPQVYLSQNEAFEWPSLNRKVINEIGTCYGLRQQIGIQVNGDVVPCCLDSEGDCLLGNVFEENFREIIEGEKVNKIVKGFENNKIIDPLCQRCAYRQRFIKH